MDEAASQVPALERLATDACPGNEDERRATRQSQDGPREEGKRGAQEIHYGNHVESVGLAQTHGQGQEGQLGEVNEGILLDSEAVMERIRILCEQAFKDGYREGYSKGFERGAAVGLGQSPKPQLVLNDPKKYS